jgi:Ca2+-binding RTX toxin-like protein
VSRKRTIISLVFCFVWSVLISRYVQAQFVKDSSKANISTALLQLSQEYAAALAQGRAAALEFTSRHPLVRTSGGYVAIDAVATGDAEVLRTELEALGLRNAATFGRMVSGRLPIDAINAMTGLKNLKFVRPVAVMTNVGLVDSQGDAALQADVARATFGVDGTGITVGTLSDSFDCLGGAAADVARGDLPSGINVLAEFSDCNTGTDEGRAMMQLIADVAPGAAQAFHTAADGMADFANGIIELQAAGADVIVDDVIYFVEPMFQDGIIAQAVDQVVANGASYFSSAGNSDRQSYESAFRPSGISPPGYFTNVTNAGNAHDFNAGAGIDICQTITIPEGGTFIASFQWDQPFFSISGAPGAANDMDILIYDNTSCQGARNIVAFSFDDNVRGDAVELLGFFNPPGSGVTRFGLVLVKFRPAGGPNPDLMKYINFGQGTIRQFDTASSTLFGHANAAGAEAVGTTFYGDTPAFGQNPPLLEPFSSAGATPILFDTNGNPTCDLRPKPEIVAPDGTNTTFFGGGDVEGDSFPNFFGTSAAAPHAAAVAALIKDFNATVTPAQIYQALEGTAIDIRPRGFDDDSGFGLIQADAAIGSVPVRRCGSRMVTHSGTDGPDLLIGTPQADVIDGLGGNDTLIGLGGDDFLCGGNGNDTLIGGLGADSLFGQDGADFLLGDQRPDRLVGGAGSDVLLGGTGNDTLLGGSDNDLLFGEAGNDTMQGRGGNDSCDGGNGNGDTATRCETSNNTP